MTHHRCAFTVVPLGSMSVITPEKEHADHMVQLAEVVDAVIGGDTHRDTHALERVAPNGATVFTLTISNDDVGFAKALA